MKCRDKINRTIQTVKQSGLFFATLYKALADDMKQKYTKPAPMGQ